MWIKETCFLLNVNFELIRFFFNEHCEYYEPVCKITLAIHLYPQLIVFIDAMASRPIVLFLLCLLAPSILPCLINFSRPLFLKILTILCWIISFNRMVVFNSWSIEILDLLVVHNILNILLQQYVSKAFMFFVIFRHRPVFVCI